MASAILSNTLDNFFADDIKVFSIKDSEIQGGSNMTGTICV